MRKQLENMDWSMPIKPIAALRWGIWARAVASRHQRLGSRHRFAVMRLLRQANPLFQSSHYWELKAWSLFPRINLAIRPALQQSILKGAPEQRTFHTLMSRTREIQTERYRDLRTPRLPDSSRVRIESRQTAPELTSMQGLGDRNFAPEPSSRQTPLTRVFRRLAPEAENEARTQLTNHSRDLTRRVVEERRRFERYAHPTPALRQEQGSRKILERTMEAQRKLEEQVASLSKGRGMGDNRQGISTINAPDGFSIQQITEQVMRRIDDKIIAHKERMGTLF